MRLLKSFFGFIPNETLVERLCSLAGPKEARIQSMRSQITLFCYRAATSAAEDFGARPLYISSVTIPVYFARVLERDIDD